MSKTNRYLDGILIATKDVRRLPWESGPAFDTERYVYLGKKGACHSYFIERYKVDAGYFMADSRRWFTFVINF